MRMILTIRAILVMRSTMVMGRMMIDDELVHGKDKIGDEFCHTS